MQDAYELEIATHKARADAAEKSRGVAWAESEALKEALRSGREQIEQQRDATRLTLDDPSLTNYQQDLAAARAWAFDHSLQLLDDAARGSVPPQPENAARVSLTEGPDQ